MGFYDDAAAQLAALQRRADLLEVSNALDDARREIAHARAPEIAREGIRRHLATIDSERQAAGRALDRQETAYVTSLDVLTAQHTDRKTAR